MEPKTSVAFYFFYKNPTLNTIQDLEKLAN